MKKLIVALAAALAIIAAAITWNDIQKKSVEAEDTQIPAQTEEAAELQEAAEEEPAAEEAETEVYESESIDYDAIYASHAPDEVVMTVDGRDVTWDEYYYWLEYFGETAEYYAMMYSYYGYDASIADFAPQIKESAEEQIKAFASIEKFGTDNSVELTEEELQEIEDGIKTAVEEEFGEDSEENRKAYYEELGVTEDMYMRLSRINYIYQDGIYALYGEDFEKITEEEITAWLEENEYMYASHILLATMDLGTMEELEDSEKEEKKALAEELAAELQAISDSEKLIARFNELKEEYCEDTGKAAYPDGYVFLTGEMVEEFENGYKALEDYQVSDPVLSDYGYHIIIRLPLSPEMIMEYSDNGDPLTARQEYANETYGTLMDTLMEEVECSISDSIESLDITQYIV